MRVAYPERDVDGVSPDEPVLVECFAHVGAMKGGQRHKVATDALKLITLGRGKPGARLLLALANESSARSLTGQSWLAEALRSGGVEVLVVDVEASLVEKILAAQELQKMVNPEENT